MTILGKAMPATRTKKERLLLAFLALHVGTAVSRDRLASALWPESSESQGLANLRRSLANLRQALGEASHSLSCGVGPVRLSSEDVTVDVHEFDRLIERKTTKDLRQAISLYRGPFLPESREDWATSERLARVAMCSGAIRELVQRLPTPEASHYLNLAMTLDPLNEEALRQLMSTLARGGDSSRALEVYHAHEAMVRRMYGWTLSSETTALFDRIRSDSLSPRRPAEAVKSDLILGRSNELVRLKTLLRSGRFLSIVGPPGVGKSRLARALVEDVVQEFANGFLRLDLEAEHLDVDLYALACEQWSLEGTADPRDRVRECLALGEVLVWIEGVELLPPTLGPFLEELANSSARAQFLTTGWQPIGLPGEQVLVVEPLAVGGDLSEDTGPSDAAQLFASRARVVWPGFALTRESAPKVERLCRSLEGLPLAIELAAGWTNTLPIDEICDLFEGPRGPDVISTESLAQRKRSLGDSIDVVIDTLSRDEFALMCAAGAFHDGCTLHALRSLLDLPEANFAMALRQTVSRSLLVFDGTPKRYRLLKVVRDRCYSRFLTDEREGWIDAAGNYLWRLVEDGLRNGDTLFDNYADDWLLAERENFRFQVDRWKTLDSYRSVVAEFAMVAYQVWHAPDVTAWLNRFPEGHVFPGDCEPFIRYMIAIFALWQGHPDCRKLLEESVSRCHAAGAHLWEAASWSGLSVLAEQAGDYAGQARCEQRVQQALAPLNLRYYPEHSKGIQWTREWMCGDADGEKRLLNQLQEGNIQGDWRKRYASLRGLGSLAFESGDFQMMSAWSQELAAIGERHAKHEFTHVLRWQTISATACGDYKAAKEFAERAVQVARQRQTRDREAGACLLLADIAEKQADWAEADRQLALAGHIYESTSVHRALCICVIRRAEIARNQGRYNDFRRMAVWAKSLYSTRNFVLAERYRQALESMC